MADLTIESVIKAPVAKVFRRCLIKRRVPDTGLFEDEWQDISADVMKWGKIENTLDAERLGRFIMGGMSMKFNNDSGRYNPSDDQSSFWFNYGLQQRSLVRIETGFLVEENNDGVWEQIELPNSAEWDESHFDVAAWDTGFAVFTGILWGDTPLTSQNEVTIQFQPLNQIFRDYAAENLAAYNDSLTASKFMEMVRDHQDSEGAYIFRPFFDDTTGNWEIATTTSIYADLNTSTAETLKGKSVWDVMQKLAEAENFVVYVDRTGIFRFQPRDASQSSTVFNINGIGYHDGTYGHTIKKINRYGKSVSKFYSRVQLKYREEETTTSYATEEATLRVDGGSAAWQLGEKTLSIENTWIQGQTIAENLVANLFDEVATLKNEIQVVTSFIPQLNILDRVAINYDSSEYNIGWLWDVNYWASAPANELIWDNAKGNGIKISNREFKFLQYALDLDALETTFTGREI